MNKKKHPIPSPKAGKKDPIVKVKRSEWEALVIRSRTLGALNLGRGSICASCVACLMIKDSCPSCGHRNIISD